MSFFSSLSKIIQENTRFRSGDLSDCSRMLYHWAISPLHTDSITSLQTRSGCLSTVTMFFVPIQVFSRDRCHFSLSFKNYTRGHPGSNQGPLGLQPNALPLSYIPAAYRIQYHHCKHVQVVWALLQGFLFQVKCTLAINVIFSSLSKIIQGDTRVRTRDLSDCSWMLYHWAISPLHTDSIPCLQTRAGCLSTVTMFFVPSQVFSRDRCHFSLVFQKLYKGTPGFDPGTSRTAAECSTTELCPRCIQTQ